MRGPEAVPGLGASAQLALGHASPGCALTATGRSSFRTAAWNLALLPLPCSWALTHGGCVSGWWHKVPWLLGPNVNVFS